MFNSIINKIKFYGIYTMDSILNKLIRKNDSKVEYLKIDEELTLMKTTLTLNIGKNMFIENEVRFNQGRYVIVKHFTPFRKVKTKLWVYGMFSDKKFGIDELATGPSLQHTKESVLDKQILEVMRMQKFAEILVIRDGDTIRMYETIKTQRGL